MSGAEREASILSLTTQVRRIAMKFRQRLPKCVQLDDLISAGTLGAISAVDRFDPARQLQLKTYAESKIRGAILDSLRDLDWAPRQQRMDVKRETAAADAFAQLHGRHPNGLEVAELLGLPLARYRALQLERRTLHSLDYKTPEGVQYVQMIRAPGPLPEELAGVGLLAGRLETALKKLPVRMRRIVVLRFFGGLSQIDIARRLEIHESRVSQVLSEALPKLRGLLTRHPARHPVRLAA